MDKRRHPLETSFWGSEVIRAFGPLVSRSNNKYNLMSHEDWVEILAIAAPDVFPRELLKGGSKWQLLHGRHHPWECSSFPEFPQTRSTDVFVRGTRHWSLWHRLLVAFCGSIATYEG
eukprot:6434967-Amphidinium_carterae.1